MYTALPVALYNLDLNSNYPDVFLNEQEENVYSTSMSKRDLFGQKSTQIDASKASNIKLISCVSESFLPVQCRSFCISNITE